MSEKVVVEAKEAHVDVVKGTITVAKVVTWGKVLFGASLVLITIGFSWAVWEAKVSAHFKETSELIEVNKEICYAMFKHANLDPLGCYDASHRGLAWK